MPLRKNKKKCHHAQWRWLRNRECKIWKMGREREGERGEKKGGGKWRCCRKAAMPRFTQTCLLLSIFSKLRGWRARSVKVQTDDS